MISTVQFMDRINVKALNNVFKSIVHTKLIYALPMLFGHLTEHQIELINSIFRKARKWQLTTDEYDIVAIAKKLRYDLFQQSKCVTHCINHLYTPSQNTNIMGLPGSPATGTQLLHSINEIRS